MTGANNSGATYAAFFELPDASRLAGDGLKSQSMGTEMKNFRYLDQPFVPRAVALRSMLAETDAKIAMAAPREKPPFHHRADVLREWLTPK